MATLRYYMPRSTASTGVSENPVAMSCFTVVCCAHLHVDHEREHSSSWGYLFCASIMMQRSYFALRYGHVHWSVYAGLVALLTGGLRGKETGKFKAPQRTVFVV